MRIWITFGHADCKGLSNGAIVSFQLLVILIRAAFPRFRIFCVLWSMKGDMQEEESFMKLFA